MGTEGIWVPLVMSAIAGGATYVNNRQQTKKQDSILAQQLLGANDRQRRADAEVQQLLDRTGESSMQDEKQGRLGEYLGQLAQALPASQGGLLNMPSGSSAHQRDAEAAALGVADTGRTYADRVSTIDAAGLQRQGEQVDRSRTATQDLSLIGREQQGADRMTDLRLRGIRSNPWLEALAAAASAYGGTYTGGGGGGGKAAGVSGYASAPQTTNPWRGIEDMRVYA